MDEERDLRRRTIGAFIRKARLDAGLCQRELAETFGYSSGQFVSNWERGISLPPLQILPKLAASLSLTGESLVALFYKYDRTQLERRREALNQVFSKARRRA